MPLNRPKLTPPHPTRANLTLDEPSFQDLLSAAYTIQEHNDRRKQARQAQTELETHSAPEAVILCAHCGSPKPDEESRCPNCGLDEFRPGERMQRNWASMWLMSQEQGLWPERPAEIREAARKDFPPRQPERGALTPPAPDAASSGMLALPFAETASPTAKRANTTQAKTQTKIKPKEIAVVRDQAFDTAPRHRQLPDKIEEKNNVTTDVTKNFISQTFATEDLLRDDAELAVQTLHLSASDDFFPSEATTDPPTRANETATGSLLHRLADLRVTLRFHRADLYLGAAICIATLALLWPAATSPRRAALGPWERALITLGIAEAPATPVVHLQGDPAIEVWVDPHTALYYCPGEEQYGRTADGRVSSQREAQMDRFEPASRAACE